MRLSLRMLGIVAHYLTLAIKQQSGYNSLTAANQADRPILKIFDPGECMCSLYIFRNTDLSRHILIGHSAIDSERYGNKTHYVSNPSHICSYPRRIAITHPRGCAVSARLPSVIMQRSASTRAPWTILPPKIRSTPTRHIPGFLRQTCRFA